MELEDQLREALIKSLDEVSQSTVTLPMKLAENKPDLNEGGQLICCVEMGSRLESTLAITASGQGACKVASKILNSEILELNQDVAHVMGEFTTKVAESIKTNLSEAEHKFEVGIAKSLTEQEFDLVKSKYLVAIKKYFENELCSIEASLMYKIPSLEEQQEAPSQEPSGETPGGSEPPSLKEEMDKEGIAPAPEEPTEPSAEADPKLILKEVEKDETQTQEAASTAPKAPSTDIPDDLMSEAMKKLDEVLKGFKEAQTASVGAPAAADAPQESPQESSEEPSQESSSSEEKSDH